MGMGMVRDLDSMVFKGKYCKQQVRLCLSCLGRRLGVAGVNTTLMALMVGMDMVGTGMVAVEAAITALALQKKLHRQP